MKFRFSLTHRGSEISPFQLPPLSDWDSTTGVDPEWATGTAPSVTLPGTGTFGDDQSEYLYTDFSFVAGVDYTITINYTKTYLEAQFNPFEVELHILDDSFASIFDVLDATPESPGGEGTVTISFTANASCKKVAIRFRDGSEATFVVNSTSATKFDPNDVTVSKFINEPDGWKDSILKLARDKDFRSLIEFFEGSFIFYGTNGIVDGGIDFIKGLELTYGPDVNIEMLIELTLDDFHYEDVFNGQLDISLSEELMDNKFRIPIIRDNFWAKFMNRKETPVDLHAETDLDFVVVEDPVDSVQLLLPSQIITYFTHYNARYSITYDTSTDVKCMLNWDEVIQDDIKLFTIARAAVPFEIYTFLGLFEAPYDGDFRVEIKMPVARYISGTPEWSADSTMRVRIKKTNSDAEDIFAFPDDATDGVDGTDTWLKFDIDETYKLFRGEQLVIALNAATGDPTVFGTTRVVWKANCAVATTQAIVLSGEHTIDGVLTSADRVLVKNQGNTEENGIYVSGAGAWTRATDMDAVGEFTDTAVFVTGGDFQADTAWRQTQEVNTPGVDSVQFQLTDPSDERFRVWPGYDADEPVENYIKITAKTKYKATEQPGMLIHDAAAAILKSYGLGETNPFYSETLGSPLTNARQYDQDGCAWKNVILRGLQLRGYSLADKPFFLSFDEWWKGVNPIFNLGLSYEFREGSTTDVTETDIQDLVDWLDAPDTGFGWNYALFSYPFNSINSGGFSKYTTGLMATIAGQTYVITAIFEIFDTGTNPVNMTMDVSILDGSYNVIETVSFNYSSAGFKQEIFNITPAADGTYIGVKVANDSVSDTKSLVIRMIEGDTVNQLLDNEEFLDASTWTNEGAGTSWTIGSDEATVSVASGASKALTQVFAGGDIGEYHFISEYKSENIGGGESAQVTLNFYDSLDNLISTKTEGVFINQTNPLDWVFTSLVVVVKVEIIFEVLAGTDIDFTLPYAGMFVVVDTPLVVIPDEQVIRVEDVEHFYDADYLLTISNIRDITRKYDNDVIYNKINMGYNTWRSEDISGIDDTQTQHIRSTRFEKIGQVITLWSEFIAASLAIEQARRKTIAESTDYKFDDSTFIIAVNPDDVSPDTYQPELDENFSDITNLLDPEVRYNTRLTPSRNFLRWRKWFNGCLQNFLSSFYKFVRGEGNFDMSSTMIAQSPECDNEDYDNQPLEEKDDIPVTDDFIHLPNYYTMEVPLDWEDYKTIRNNRKKAIGISLTDDNHVALFIDQLDYNIFHGKAKISGWTNEFMNLTVPEDTPAQQTCLPATDCLNPITDENDEVLTDEFGVCITA